MKLKFQSKNQEKIWNLYVLWQTMRMITDAYQDIQRWILFLERLSKLPHFASLGQVNDMDVHLLQQPEWVYRVKNWDIEFIVNVGSLM